MNDFDSVLIREMTDNIRTCPDDRCGSCNLSTDIIDKQVSVARERYNIVEFNLLQFKKYALDHWVTIEMWDGMITDLEDRRVK